MVKVWTPQEDLEVARAIVEAFEQDPERTIASAFHQAAVKTGRSVGAVRIRLQKVYGLIKKQALLPQLISAVAANADEVEGEKPSHHGREWLTTELRHVVECVCDLAYRSSLAGERYTAMEIFELVAARTDVHRTSKAIGTMLGVVFGSQRLSAIMHGAHSREWWSFPNSIVVQDTTSAAETSHAVSEEEAIGSINPTPSHDDLIASTETPPLPIPHEPSTVGVVLWWGSQAEHASGMPPNVELYHSELDTKLRARDLRNADAFGVRVSQHAPQFGAPETD